MTTKETKEDTSAGDIFDPEQIGKAFKCSNNGLTVEHTGQDLTYGSAWTYHPIINGTYEYKFRIDNINIQPGQFCLHFGVDYNYQSYRKIDDCVGGIKLAQHGDGIKVWIGNVMQIEKKGVKIKNNDIVTVTIKKDERYIEWHINDRRVYSSSYMMHDEWKGPNLALRLAVSSKKAKNKVTLVSFKHC